MAASVENFLSEMCKMEAELDCRAKKLELSKLHILSPIAIRFQTGWGKRVLPVIIVTF